MAMYNDVKDFDINKDEYGILVADAMINDKTFKLYIGKIMPSITKSATTKPLVFDKNIFVNDTKCKITCSNKVTTQGYVTLSKMDNVYLGHHCKDPKNPKLIKTGTRLKIKMMGDALSKMLVQD